MTIAVENNRVVATGNGVTTSWPFDFSCLDEDTLEVYTYEISTGTLTGPLSDSLYSVSGVPGSSGSVTYPLVGSPLASTHKIIIRRVVDLLQPASFSNAAGFDPATLTLRLDEMMRGLQQVNDMAERAYKVDISGTDSPDDILADINAAVLATAASEAAAELAETNAETAEANATQAYNDTVAAIAALGSVLSYKGAWDASAGTFPGAGAALAGWQYTVSVAGTVNGVVFTVGDMLTAIVNNASTTVYAANWLRTNASDFGLEVAALTTEDAVADGDLFGFADVSAGNLGKKTTWGNIKALMLAYFGGTSKASPVAADRVQIYDSAASFVPKYSTITQLMTLLFASSALTDTPTAPTAAAGTNTTQIATTAFVKQETREKLTAARTYYVRTDGSDSNTGLVNNSGGAFLTLQKAVTTIQALDRSTYNVTVTIGAGTFTGGVSLSGWGPGTGTVTFTGAGATTIISTTSAACYSVTGGKVIISQQKLQTTTGGDCIQAYGGVATLGTGVEFGACAGTAHITSWAGGLAELDVAYTISGDAARHFYADNGTIYAGSSRTVTASGTRAFASGFAVSTALGLIFGIGNTYSGTFTGQRYNAALNSVINTYGSGANYFPGNSAGATATGGQYA